MGENAHCRIGKVYWKPIPFRRPEPADEAVRIGRVRARGVDNVVGSKFSTVGRIDPSRILWAALKANVAELVVVGRDQGGRLYFASSQADGRETAYLLQRAQHRLMTMVDAIDAESAT